MNKIKDIIIQYRLKDIIGNIVNLSPANEKFVQDIIRMRNNNKTMYYLNQGKKLTIDDQIEWFKYYFLRYNDLYWIIKDKEERVIGTNRLYDITNEKCVQGSIIIDEQYSMSAPYAAEAIMLSINFAFNILCVNTIINEDRKDNKNMNSITKRLGFKFIMETDIRGIPYNYYELYPCNYNKKYLEELINLWIAR